GRVLVRPLRQPAPGTRTRPETATPPYDPSSLSRISRRLPASSSFVLAAARLRALQPDPWPRGGKTRAAARKIQKNSQTPPRRPARSHRVRFVCPLDNGGSYGCGDELSGGWRRRPVVQ